MDMSGNLPAAPRGDSARSRLRRMDVWAALLATAVFVSAASASAQSLHDDAGKGDIAAVTRALDSGAIPNARNEDGDSPWTGP